MRPGRCGPHPALSHGPICWPKSVHRWRRASSRASPNGQPKRLASGSAGGSRRRPGGREAHSHKMCWKEPKASQKRHRLTRSCMFGGGFRHLLAQPGDRTEPIMTARWAPAELKGFAYLSHTRRIILRVLHASCGVVATHEKLVEPTASPAFSQSMCKFAPQGSRPLAFVRQSIANALVVPEISVLLQPPCLSKPVHRPLLQARALAW